MTRIKRKLCPRESVPKQKGLYNHGDPFDIRIDNLIMHWQAEDVVAQMRRFRAQFDIQFRMRRRAEPESFDTLRTKLRHKRISRRHPKREEERTGIGDQ